MSEEVVEDVVDLPEDAFIEEDQFNLEEQKIMLRMHPLGGIGLTIANRYGNEIEIIMDQSQVASLVLNLITMNTILVQQSAMEQQMQAQRAANILRGVTGV